MSPETGWVSAAQRQLLSQSHLIDPTWLQPEKGDVAEHHKCF